MQNVLSVHKVSKSYGDRVLFQEATFGIGEGQKMALIGLNGSGKSTMMRLLVGQDAPDSGEISMRKDAKILYLDQEPEFDPNRTVEQELYYSDHPGLNALLKYNQKMAGQVTDQELHDLLDELDRTGGWEAEALMNQVLAKLGIFDLNQKMGTLSGGQKKRVALAKVMLEQPDLLLLDEPTNHLDLESIEYLEHVLSSSRMAVFMITHDRYFLDRVCNELLELDGSQIRTFKGNYAYYLEKKEELDAVFAAEQEKLKNTFRKELEWMRRQPKARTTKSKSRIDAFSELKSRIQNKKQQEIDLSFKAEHLGGKIMEFRNIGHTIAGKKLIEDFTYVFKKKDRVGIVGKNGMGKTTLLRLAMDQIQPDKGRVIHGETLKIGYFSQEGLAFNPDQKVIDVIRDVADVIELSNGKSLSASQLLTQFFFPPARQQVFVRKLSGGERKRLNLVRVLMQNPNFLIFDEPTNDLDIMTLGVLEDFLDAFPGCLMIVSHDRYFLDRLVEHLFVFEGNGLINDFPGNYSQYREYVELKEEVEQEEKLKKQSITPQQEPLITSNPTKDSEPKRKLSYKEQKELDEINVKMSELESEHQSLINLLSAAQGSIEQITSWSTRIGVVENEQLNLMERWMELQVS
jgi:ATP-binding cassette subfamily F protein uup